MSKHTPGPWVNPSAYPGEVERADGKSIATCWYEEEVGQYVYLVDIADVPLEERAANARLIAAAPDLLEAVFVTRELVCEAAATGFNWKDGDWHERLFLNQAKLSAAIAKAEGKE